MIFFAVKLRYVPRYYFHNEAIILAGHDHDEAPQTELFDPGLAGSAESA